MFYKFIRTGKNPTEQVDNKSVIWDCFAACKPEIKARLLKFFEDNERSITFNFDDHVIMIEVYQPQKTEA